MRSRLSSIRPYSGRPRCEIWSRQRNENIAELFDNDFFQPALVNRFTGGRATCRPRRLRLSFPSAFGGPDGHRLHRGGVASKRFPWRPRVHAPRRRGRAEPTDGTCRASKKSVTSASLRPDVRRRRIRPISRVSAKPSVVTMAVSAARPVKSAFNPTVVHVPNFSMPDRSLRNFNP